jgi:hypothetical protein
MHAHKLTAVMVAAIAATAISAGALTTAPAQAQTTAPTTAVKNPTTTVKKKPIPNEVAMAGRPPAKVTVRKRSYLDPGTETKARDEHYQDYAFPPGGTSYTADPNDFKINWTRMPFPSCFDLAGFCR